MWPATVQRGPICLRPLNHRDRHAWQSVRARNVEWLKAVGRDSLPPGPTMRRRPSGGWCALCARPHGPEPRCPSPSTWTASCGAGDCGRDPPGGRFGAAYRLLDRSGGRRVGHHADGGGLWPPTTARRRATSHPDQHPAREPAQHPGGEKPRFRYEGPAGTLPATSTGTGATMSPTPRPPTRSRNRSLRLPRGSTANHRAAT